MLQLDGKWRRLEVALSRVDDGIYTPDPGGADGLIEALNAIYSLWNVWAAATGLKALKSQDDHVRGDAGGETTAALIYARGGETHDVVEFGEFLGFGEMPFGRGPLGGACWFWRPYYDPKPVFSQRALWYQAYVERQSADKPLDAAYRWLQNRSELR